MLKTLPSDRPARTQRAGRWIALALGVVLAAGTLAATPAQARPPRPLDSRADARDGWRVSPLGGDRYEVSWTSPDRFPIRSDRPTITGPDDLVIGPPTVRADGRTVRAIVTAPTAPRPADLDVVLSGQRLDEADGARAPIRAASQSSDLAPAVERLAVDPGKPGPYAVVSSDYTRTPVQVAGMEQPIEMVGHVVEPAPSAAVTDRPLVLFLHGRHEYCYQSKKGRTNQDWPCRGVMREIPSQLGYDYMQRLLASQGFTTVSIRVNGINAQDYALDDGGAGARATIVAKHLDYWATIAAAHKVDLHRVVLVGHSRGGEGVDRASIRIPLSAPYRIVGQVLIAPTDFGSQTAPYVPTVTLLPYCDGDVSDLQGQQFTDVGRDLTTDDHALKSSVLIMGANHNYFNTEWTPKISVAPSIDDWSGKAKAACGTKSAGRLTAKQQRAVGQAYVAGAVQLFVDPQVTGQPLLPLFDGSQVSVASAGRAVALSHAILGGRDLRRPALDTALSTPVGATSSFCTGTVTDADVPEDCGAKIDDLVTPHWQPSYSDAPTQKFWQLSWTAAGQYGGLQLDRPMDLRNRTLDLRTIVDSRLGSVRLRVRLTDAAGGTATLAPVGGTKVSTLLRATYLTKLWAQTVRIDPAGATLDLSKVVRVEIVGDSSAGRIWVADLAAHTEQLPALTAQRMPAVSFDDVTVEEGDGPGPATARVPFHLSSPLTRPGQLSVITQSDQDGSVEHLTVELGVGQMSGSIPVVYQPNALDDPDQTATYVAGWATRNVMTDDYLGQLTIVDDDPTPEATISPVQTTVKEGESAEWQVTLGSRANYPVEVFGYVVHGQGTNLTGQDVPLAWLADHGLPNHRSLPLYKLRTSFYDVIEPGDTTVTLAMPIRKDGKREATEAVTLEVEALGSTAKQRIEVEDSR